MFQFDLTKFKNNYAEITDSIRDRCIKANRKFDELTIVIATKYLETYAVKLIVEQGIRDIGENRVQQLRERKESITATPVNWHFIGTLQSNKIKYFAEYISLVHSVNSVKLLCELNKYALKYGRKIDCLLEINLSKEPSKTGAAPTEAVEILRYYAANRAMLAQINIRGLMTMAEHSNNESAIRKIFAALRNSRDRFNDKFGLNMTFLSMGMSADYLYAVDEGATHLRIGSAFFK